MAKQIISPVMGTATRAFLAKLGPVLKQAVDGAKDSDKVETGVVVSGEWQMVQIWTAAEIRNVIRELKI